ncbi:exodeoxyribonuclease V subunit gamma [Jatrophihabitans endophyticus]|uniref:exodeoxyribonuclease V subunit gamma n=1 Tax=Jatrophihabitans endophyticus TaxID=1206085 RepID=UPI00190E6695|nr:exodeoxyribonuclease V subunit gamma [Jatrophihabitans endophyticus]
MTGLLIHRSERADPLVSALGDLLRQPLADPFAAEVVAVPSRGVERWLAQRLSHVLGAVDDDGICANVQFPSSNRVLDDAIAAADESYAECVERWSAERAVWPLLTIVDTAVDREPWAAALAGHLAGDPTRRFAVANKVAHHFARYARSRPAMLTAWLAGRDDEGDGTPLPADLRWQPQLWRRLREQLGPSPAELLDDACARLREHPQQVALPPRFSIFGTTRISPARVAVLDALAAGRELHLWLHHPSPALWQAVAREQPGPGLRAADRGAALVANPLLASLSRDVRELQQLLPTASGVHHPVPPRPANLLGRLQVELADDVVPERPAILGPADRSLAVHACHGPARQVEVLREIVLGLLRDDPTLEPRDILVMCPDVETFAPLVSAAFGMTDEPSGHPAAHLRVRLADRALRQVNPMLGLLDQLLDLAAERVTATQLLDLAGTPPVRRRFGFTDDDIERLRGWTTATNARWGLDADHRAPYGLGGLGQGTWRAAVDRLLLGVAMEEDGRWIGSVLPLDDVDSGDIDLAGRLAELVTRVDAAVRTFAERHTVPEWAAVLGAAVLDIGDPVQAWQGVQLRSELDDVAETATDTDVRLGRADVAALLRSRLDGRPTRASFRTGTLTVCTLVPMRSVPHRVICLIGMDDGRFPRHGVADGDDVLRRAPRTGERDVRSEDRQLFLDALCAAQEHLVVTYTGADPRSGAEVPPCVPLGELLDAVDATAQTADGRRGRDQVVVRHPLQPFDPRNFAAGDPFSFDPAALDGARAAAGVRHPPPPLVTQPLDPAPRGDVELDDLVRFVQHPARAFLRQRLGISTWDDDDDPSDALPVGLDGLESWAVGDRVLRQCLHGATAADCVEIEGRRGDLPPGQLGRALLRDIGANVDCLLAACALERATAPRTVDVTARLDDGRAVSGTIGGVRGGTVLDVVYSRLAPRHRLAAWVRHLALVAGTGDPTWQSVTVGRRTGGAKRAILGGVDVHTARDVLAEIVALRDAGLREPLPMALVSSAEYAQRRHRGDDVADARQAAQDAWDNARWGDHENAEPEHQLVFDGRRSWTRLTAEHDTGFPDETTRFAVLARRLWTPLLAAEVEVSP